MRRMGWVMLVALSAACRCAPGRWAGLDGGVTFGKSAVEVQPPDVKVPPCDPHIDGTDDAHKLAIVESALRVVKVGEATRYEIVLLDAPGACAFDPEKAGEYRAVKLLLTDDGARRPPLHFELGAGDSARFEFLFSVGGKLEKLGATGGSVDLIELGEAGASLGYSIKTAKGESFGCFKAKRCAP